MVAFDCFSDHQPQGIFNHKSVIYPSNVKNEIKYSKMKLFGGVHPFYKVIAILATVDKMECIHKLRLNL